MNSPRVLVSIVNWNGGSAIVECLEQVRAQECPNVRVVIIDNASTDGSVAALRRRDPSLEIIENAANLGFAGGHNVALRHGLSRGIDYFWLLNFDTRIGSEVLHKLVETSEREPAIGAISPVIYEAGLTERIQFQGTCADVQNCAFLPMDRLTGCEDQLEINSPLLWGTAILLRAEAIRRAGLLDERYFAYYEDYDLSNRINRAGFTTCVTRSTRIWHAGVNSIVNRPPHYTYFNTRNLYLYWKDRLPVRSRMRYVREFAIRTLCRIADLKAQSRPDLVSACVCGFADALLDRYGPWQAPRSPPRWLHLLLTARPYALTALLEGRWLSLAKGFVANIRDLLRPIFRVPLGR